MKKEEKGVVVVDERRGRCEKGKRKWSNSDHEGNIQRDRKREKEREKRERKKSENGLKETRRKRKSRRTKRKKTERKRAREMYRKR